MKITTERISDLVTGETLTHSWYEYSGPVALAGGGKSSARRTQEQIMREQQDLARQESAQRQRQLGLAEPIVSELESETGPGRISRYAAAQLAQENDQIANTFAGLRKTAIRSLGARGLSSDRSGLARTSMNALGEQENAAGTDAFRNALANTLNQRMAALNWRMGQRTEAGQESRGQYEGSSSAAARRAEMGSGFGDVMGGITQAAGIASDLFAPGSGVFAKKAAGAITRKPPLVSRG
jgi:hypothetical protein